jgi:large subunit ribosomal protein L15
VKLHDLRPAAGSRRARTRVGRGIAAGQGKTAGRGTKGQKSRTGASIPAWFEGGQTPIHVRVPKLRGFKRRFRVEYAVVNIGQISAYAEAGRFGVELDAPKPARGKRGDQPVATVNAEVLASAGLIRDLAKPIKILGQGEVSQKLFVAADAFSASARRKIEEAGGFVQVLAPETETVAATEGTAEPATTAQPETAAVAETEAVAESTKTSAEKEAVAETEAVAESTKTTAETEAVAKTTATVDEPTKPRRRAKSAVAKAAKAREPEPQESGEPQQPDEPEQSALGAASKRPRRSTCKTPSGDGA